MLIGIILGLVVGFLIGHFVKFSKTKTIAIETVENSEAVAINSDSAFTVISDGASSDQEIKSIENDGCHVCPWARDVMGQSSYAEGIPLAGESYDLEIILGSEFSDEKRTIENIRALAKSRGLIDMPTGLTNKAVNANQNEKLNKLGLVWLIFMTNLITDSDGYPNLLGLSCHGDGRWLDGFYGRPGSRWDRKSGFVFLRPRKK